MHMKSFILVVTGMVAITSINCEPHSAPTGEDLFAHMVLNQVRTNPKLILSELNSMLCLENNPVPSPGGTYDSLNNLCSSLTGALWKIIGPIIGKGQTAKQFCDSTIR